MITFFSAPRSSHANRWHPGRVMRYRAVLFAMLVLSFLTLQGFASLFLPSGRRWLGPEIGRHVISEVLGRTMINWLSTYRADLEADLAALRAPLAALQSALDVSPAAHEPEPRQPLPRSAGARVQKPGV